MYILGLVKVNRGPIELILLGMCLGASKTDDSVLQEDLGAVALKMGLAGSI